MIIKNIQKNKTFLQTQNKKLIIVKQEIEDGIDKKIELTRTTEQGIFVGRRSIGSATNLK